MTEIPAAVIPVILGLLALVLATQPFIISYLKSAKQDRKELITALQELRDYVYKQNGRIGKLEVWRDNHDDWAKRQSESIESDIKRLEDDTWRK